ncbi:hypothetical protein BDV12DRAFT_204478 [Aspergillus spectabilis]
MRRRRVTSESDIRLATGRQRALLGSAKVKTDHLDIGPQSELCTEKVETLCRVFRKVGVNRYHQENHVEVLISRAMFERALEHCGIAANELCQKTPGEYPLLDFAEVSEELRRTQSESYHHESSPSTGKIYVKGRWYEEQGDQAAADRWWARLSNCEEERLAMLEKHPQLWRAFDSLCKIPAIVSSGALLSVWNKLLALHCDDELIDYLTKIRVFWESIAFNDVTKMRDITCEDVKALQGLAPGISLVDRTEIGKLVRGGALFQEFSPAERECIYEKLLLDPGKCLQSDGKRAVQRTIRETMEYMFERESGDIDIQTSDTSYRKAPCNVEMQFDLAYRQVWLCSLRYSSGRPSKGKKHTILNADTPPYALYQVALLASQLGFKSPRISEALRSCPDPEACPWYDFDNDRVPALKRQGIPYVVTFRDDRELLFLDRIHGPLEESHSLPSGFVLRDIYMAFFGGLCDLPPVHDQRGTQSTTGSGFGLAREHNATDNSPQGESGPQQPPEARSSPETHSTSSNPTCAANSPAEPVDESMLQSPTFPPDTEQPPPQSQASVEDPGTSTSAAPNNAEGCETNLGPDTTNGDASAYSMEWTSNVDFLKQQLCDQREKLLSACT